MVLRTKGKDTKSRLVKIIPLKEWEKDSSFSDVNQEKEQVIEVKPLKPEDTKPLESLIELTEVEVTKSLAKEQKASPSVYGIDVLKSRIKFQDPKRLKSIAQLCSEIPGVVVSGIGTLYPSVTILRATGGGQKLWVVDGFPLRQGNSLIDVMDRVSTVDVERIELIIGPDASIYGTRGSGGVFAIYTRSGNEREFVSRKDGQLVFEGYEPILAFDHYQQNLSKRIKEKTNLLYWNPKLETDENGEAIINIPLVLQDTTIKVEVSTITSEGEIGAVSIVF